MTVDYRADIDAEDVQRQTIKILYDKLNTEISARNTQWTVKDNAFYASIGRASPGFTVEEISPENFYPGVVPSLIKAPIENYPNVSAYVSISAPTGSGDDVAEEYRMTLAIEVMVKSVSGELEVNSRIQKTLEAVHAVMIKNPLINGTVNTMNPPLRTTGDVFVRREDHSRGDRWFWQGGSLTYPVEKYGILF